MYQFRDPIHGFIDVSPLEIKIIDAAPFQRLRRIKQLATTDLVYPGAEHTRFGHSLGVMHLVSRAFNSALKNYKESYGQNLFDSIWIKWYEQILRLTALTHDLGHAPYSHTSEALFEDGLEHEDFTKKILFETEIGGYIYEIGRAFCEENCLGDEFNITPELIWLIYGDQNPELDPLYKMPDFKFLRSFMDSELDCDKMDYLLRDSYYCGVNYGKYDLNRLLASLNVYKNDDGNIMQLAINRSGIHVFEEFVIARYFMFIQVYFHKTRRYLDKLLIESISGVLSDHKYPSGVDEYLMYDDHVIYNKIKKNQKNLPSADQFINRQVKTCVYDSGTHSDLANDIRLYNMVKRELKSKFGDVIDEDTAVKLAHKIPSLESFDSESGKGIPILVQYFDKPASISTESILLQNLAGKPINIKRIYIDKCHAAEAKDIIKKFINAED